MCASRQLLLSDNALSGTIPSNLSAMSVLTYLSMGNNRVTGSIPATVGSISRLAWMSVSGNALNGTLPSTLTGMAALGYVAAWVTTPGHLCVTTDCGTHLTRLCVTRKKTAIHRADSCGNGRSVCALEPCRTLDLSFNNFSGVVSVLGSMPRLRCVLPTVCNGAVVLTRGQVVVAVNAAPLCIVVARASR